MHTMNAAQFEALKELVDDCEEFLGEDACDHSVGICSCDTYRVLNVVKDFIKGETA